LCTYPDNTIPHTSLSAPSYPATGAGYPLSYARLVFYRYCAIAAYTLVSERSYLSVLDEAVAYGARAWTTYISLPHPGVY